MCHSSELGNGYGVPCVFGVSGHVFGLYSCKHVCYVHCAELDPTSCDFTDGENDGWSEEDIELYPLLM